MVIIIITVVVLYKIAVVSLYINYTPDEMWVRMSTLIEITGILHKISGYPRLAAVQVNQKSRSLSSRNPFKLTQLPISNIKNSDGIRTRIISHVVHRTFLHFAQVFLPWAKLSKGQYPSETFVKTSISARRSYHPTDLRHTLYTGFPPLVLPPALGST